MRFMNKKNNPHPRLDEKKQHVHPLVKFNYAPRTIGFAVYGVILALLFMDSRNIFLWLAIVAQTLVWPHLAYLHGKYSRNGKRAEYNNLYFEAFLVGVWMNLADFQLWPSTVFLVGAAINLLATRGLAPFRNALMLIAAGILAAGLFNGFTFTPPSSLPVTYACIAFLVIYSSIVAFLSFQTANKLRTSRQRTEAIFDSIQSGVLVIDEKSHKIISANPAAARMVGVSRDEIEGHVCHQFLCPAAAGACPISDQNVRMDSSERILLDKDGKEIPVLKTVVPFILEGRRCLLESFVDISDRKHMEDELQRLARAVEQSIDGIAVADMDGNIQFANGAWAKMHGRRPEEVLGRHISIFHTREQLETDVEPFNAQVMKNGSNDGEVGHVRKDGTVFPTWMTTTLLKDETGRPVGLLGIARDITERKQAEDELRITLEAVETMNLHLEKQTALANEMAVRAEAANIAKSQFLANMSHEIRTPMNAVMGMAYLLSDTPLTEEQQYFVKTIQQSTDSLLNIINDILDFSKIEAGKLDLEMIEFDLVQLLEDTNNMMEIDARHKNLKYACRIDPAVPRRIYGDPGRLRQILVNLIGNAIKFTPRGGVEISVKPDGTEPWTDGRQVVLAFAVKDTGIGISAQKIETLFDAFTQVDASTTRQFGGTGLGLTIARNLIEMMGGRLHVDSREGDGSTFTFTVKLKKGISAADASAAPEIPAPVLSEKPAAGKRRQPAHILVAEDLPVNQEVVRAFLESFDFTVHIVENGRQAIDALSRDHYDLVLMDVQMPEMDGIAATKVIRDPASGVLDHEVAIVALTGHAMEGDRDRYHDVGMNDYLPKPIKPDALYAVVMRNLPEDRK
jgi:PAS domain S-box-containing protein